MLAGDVPAGIIARTGNFDRMFLRMADYTGLEISVQAVFRDEMPGDPEEYCGVIVTGFTGYGHRSGAFGAKKAVHGFTVRRRLGM